MNHLEVRQQPAQPGVDYEDELVSYRVDDLRFLAREVTTSAADSRSAGPKTVKVSSNPTGV
jgi:hypothetical protein